MFQELIAFIKELYAEKETIYLHEPILGDLEKKYLCEAIDSTFVSSIGPFVNRFEDHILNYVGTKYAIATVNGTSALHLSLSALGIGSNDLVVTQSLSFVAASNAISYCGAQPVFLDIDKDTLSLSPDKLREFLERQCKIMNNQCIHIDSGKAIPACLPVHIFGHPAKIREIKTICDERNISLIEDSAESLGSYYDDKHTGGFGLCGIFSFNGNKIVTAGGGGCIVTNHDAFAKKLKHLSETAKINTPTELNHDEIGFNYRMPNINAALLMAQLERLPEFLKSKQQIALEYQTFFKSTEMMFIHEPENSHSNYWLNSILLNSKATRDQFLRETHEHQIMTRPCWKPIHQMKMYQQCINDGCSLASDLAFRLVNLPSGARHG